MTFGRAGWVLVGGRSSRMGTDKARVEIQQGHTLALLAAEKLVSITNSVALVGDPEKYGDLGLPVIPDLRPGMGPLAGMEAALQATSADWNVIVACDIPGVPPGLIARMFELTDGADGVVPRHRDGKLEPLCALYHKRALPSFSRSLDQGTRRVTEAISALTLRYLPVADDRAFLNLNTPDDVERYRNV